MQVIRNLRESLGATQQDMATALGVDRSTIGKWEAPGSYPRPKFLKAIADYLGCTIDFLFESEPNGKEA